MAASPATVEILIPSPARVPCPIHPTHTPSQPSTAGSSTVFPCHTQGDATTTTTPQKERKGQRGSRRLGAPMPREVYIDLLRVQYVFAAFTTSKTCSFCRLPEFRLFRFGWPVVIWTWAGFSFSWVKCMCSEVTACLSSQRCKTCQCMYGHCQLHALFHRILRQAVIVDHIDTNGAILTIPRATRPVGRPMTMPGG